MVNPVPPRQGASATVTPIHPGQRRGVVPQRPDEVDQRLGRALHLDAHALAGIGHRAGQPERAGRCVDKGPEPNPLHQAVDVHHLPSPVGGGARHSLC